jgi:hypothetical protein
MEGFLTSTSAAQYGLLPFFSGFGSILSKIRTWPAFQAAKLSAKRPTFVAVTTVSCMAATPVVPLIWKALSVEVQP